MAERGSAANGRGRTTRWLIGYPRAIPVGIFIAIAAITSLSVFAIERGERQREDSLMRATAQAVVSGLERRGNTSSSYLRAGAALFTTVDDVNLSLFRRFVSELRLDSDYRGADGIGWAEAISAAEITAYEQRIGSEMPTRITVTTRSKGAPEVLVPVTYLEPDTARNRRALGFDMYSESMRRAAMDEAVRMVRPTASGKVVLLQEGGEDAPGFLVYMPVFDRDFADLDLKGFIYSPFNAQQFLEDSIETDTLGGRGVRFFDGEANSQNLLAELEPENRTGLIVRQEVEIANRPMLVEIESNKVDMLSSLSMATLLFGLAVASLLMLVSRLLAQQAKEDERAIEFFREQNSIRDSLARELNHRVKNTLANVLSIVSLTRRRTDDVGEFADGLAERVRALSATHALLTQSEWGVTPVRAIIEEELAPYVDDPETALVLDGPDVGLAPNDALTLGMAIHELATNAAKYGALSTPEGRVNVEWYLVNEGLMQLEWSESGGPAVSELREPGFGTELIEKIVAHELKHPVELVFAETGVRCVLRIPVRVRGEFQIRELPPRTGH
ncbi:CHASE domain-containing protein [Altererythrobacter arenosus]|uniref:histidine kinase n=1 Tax=Altererythrobacter arenosus TaxID=3032592 RepID=A0ABY8FMN1_9SPHN|nr:CHASE domain-containing protein [Altererythrobacter sp. CAU 1644]WFL76112.1 CHASE domain-containing protein [Altererythrobacter sp. CAU 1644]